MSVKQRDRKGERGAVVAGLLAVILAVIALLITPFFVFGKIVRPDEMGLRQNYFGFAGLLEEGYGKVGLRSGLHWQFPYISTVHVVPRDFLIIHFSGKKDDGDLVEGPLEVPSEEGAKISVNTTILLRYGDGRNDSPASTEEAVPTIERPLDNEGVMLSKLTPEPVNGPASLVNAFGLDLQEQLRVIATSAQGVVKGALGSLATTEFYNPALREAGSFLATDQMNEQLSPKGVQVVHTLIRRYRYPRKIDNRIFEKNLEEQLERVARATTELRKIEKVTAELVEQEKQLIADSQSEAQARSEVLRSEGDLYEGEKIAEGKRLVEEVQATVFDAKQEALQQAKGADIYAALEALPILKSLKGGVVSGINPYEIDEWTELLGVEGREKQR